MERKGREGKTKQTPTTTKPIILHLPRIPLELVILRTPLEDLEGVAWDDDVGRVGATGPFLAVGAVAEGRDCGLGCEFVFDGRTHAGAFCHFC